MPKLVWVNPNTPTDDTEKLLSLSDEELERIFNRHNRCRPVLCDAMTTAEHVERWFRTWNETGRANGAHNE
jgi:hypothetical protein